MIKYKLLRVRKKELANRIAAVKVRTCCKHPLLKEQHLFRINIPLSKNKLTSS